MKINFVIEKFIELYLNQLYLPNISKVTEAYWSHILLCWDLFVRISTKALCSSLIAFIINGQNEQKKKKYRKIYDKIANLVANDKYENEIEFIKGMASNLHLFQSYLRMNWWILTVIVMYIFNFLFNHIFFNVSSVSLSQNLYIKYSSSDIT